MPNNSQADVYQLMAERYDTKSNVKLGEFQSQLEVSFMSSHTEELWYNETVCLWMTIYIYITFLNYRIWITETHIHIFYVCVCVCVYGFVCVYGCVCVYFNNENSWYNRDNYEKLIWILYSL